MFAKISIYKDEFELKAKNGKLSKEVIDTANLQVKLQQAQFLAKLYSEKAAEQTKVNEKELTSYIAAHPKFKRSAARKELETAKENRLFAELIAKHNIHVAADFTVPTKPQD